MKNEQLKQVLNKVYCRTFQTGMKLADYVIGYRIPNTIEGPGSVKKLAHIIRNRGLDEILIVTDPTLVKIGLLNGMLASFDKEGLHYTVFSDVEKNPTSDNVEEGFRIYQKHLCRALVGFGGGAPIDCAKAIAAKSVHPDKTIAQLQGVLKVLKKTPPFFAVPTTAGTGSETTLAAVIIDSATHHKASINDPALLPELAVLDPELTTGLPPKVTATTGMDALCHAVESYTNHTYNTDLEDFLAKEAVRLIHENLLTAYQDGANLQARAKMQKAAFYAGRSFTRGCVGYVHAVGHTLGGLYGVPHGLAMSIILPYVMRQFGPAVYDRLADLADVCNMEGSSREEKAEAFIAWIEQMKKDMNIPEKTDVIQDQDVGQIIDWAMAEANPLYPTPVTWERKDFEKLIASIRA